jgi:hypothetical protein
MRLLKISKSEFRANVRWRIGRQRTRRHANTFVDGAHR